MDSSTPPTKAGAVILTIFDQIWDQKGAFFGTFFAVLLLSYGILVAVDFIPEKPSGVSVVTEYPDQTQTATTSPAEEKADVVAPLPVRIVIDELGTDSPVLNPEESDIATLDTALLSGVVRHPDSADFKDEGTIVLFGHSSYLPTVHNKNFQAFNGIQKLTWGDTIRVESEDTEYVYRVQKTYKAKASGASVELEHGEARLILVTCNSFGSKDDRFVVEAELIEKRAL